MSNSAKRRARRAHRLAASDLPRRDAMMIEARGSIIKAADGEAKQRRFKLVIYTGEPLRQEHMGWDYPVVVDMKGINAGTGRLPILDNHGPKWSSDEDIKKFVVGQSDFAGIKSGEYILEGPMFEQQDKAKEIIALADQGFDWQSSIGARTNPKRVEFYREGESVEVNGRTYEGPVYVSRETDLREGSFVVIGDDKHTSALVASGALMKKNILGKMSKAEFCKAKGFDYEALNATQKATMDAMFADFNASADDGEDDEEDEDDDDGDGRKTKAKASAKLDITAQARADLDAAQKASREALVRENQRIRALQTLCVANPALQGEVLIDGETKAVVLLDHAIMAGWVPEQLQPHVKLAEIKAQQLAGVRDDRPASAPFGYVVSDPIAQGSAKDPHFMTKAMEAAILLAGNYLLESDSYYFQRGREGQMERRVPENIQASAQRDYKARYTDQVLQAAHTTWGKGIGLWQVLAIAARGGGYRGSDIITDGNLGEILRCAFAPNIRADGSSTISIQNVLANVMNKFLLQGYLNSDQSWRYICAVRAVKDFKPTKSINLTGDFVFKKLNGDGQIVNATMTDEAFANQIDTLARKLGISRQTIINDDMSALTTVPLLMGLGGADGLNILIWTLWNSPGNGPDGTAFWNSARTIAANALGGNAVNPKALASGGSSALQSSSLQSAVTLFDKQVKPNGQPLGVPPEILLYPPELDQTAIELMNAQFIVGPTSSKQPNTNTFYKRFVPVKSPYVSNASYTGFSLTAWWLLASPQRLPAIEVAFLNGQETATVQTAQANFNELGIDIRGCQNRRFSELAAYLRITNA